MVFEPRTFDLGVKKPKSELTDWLTGYLSVVFPGVPGAEQQLGLGAGAEPLHADVHGEQIDHPQGTTHHTLLLPSTLHPL